MNLKEETVDKEHKDLEQYRQTLDGYSMQISNEAKTVRADAGKVKRAISSETVRISDSPVIIPEVPKRVEKRKRRKAVIK